MTRSFLLIFMLLMPLDSLAIEKITDVYQREKFSENIRRSGNVCFRCTEIYLIEEDDRGTIYRIMCNNSPTFYTVIVSRTGRYTVKPW